MFTIERITMEWRIPLVGNYNACVDYCPKCGKSISISTNCIGFASIPDHAQPNAIQVKMGNLTATVIECPECFTKYWFHANDWVVGGVEDTIDLLKEQGKQHLHLA